MPELVQKAVDALRKGLEFCASELAVVPDEALEGQLFSFDSSLGLVGDQLRPFAIGLLKQAAEQAVPARELRLLSAADQVERGKACGWNEQGH